MGLRKWIADIRRTSPSAAAARAERITREVEALSIEEAEALVTIRLAAHGVLKGTISPILPTDAERVARLPATARSLFERYRSIESNSMQLSRDVITAFRLDPAYLRIGFDLGDAEVIVSSESGIVSVVEDEGKDVVSLDDSYPSVWHYLLVVIESSKPM